MIYETIIGLEIHSQLLTASKMFCACSTQFGASANYHICPICSGQPGVLPVINKKAILLALKTALALNCQISPFSLFARKNYFYPDLPKNYQISQYELPLTTQGYLEIEVEGEFKKIGITRVHLEEDAGKLIHKGANLPGRQAGRILGAEESLVDFNRAGIPLLEIVSQPDLRSPQEAKIFMEELAHLLQYLEICDAKMEEGSLRCDANISVREFGVSELGIKTEVKNMNSFRAVFKALEAEEKRHREILESGGKVIQETRFYDDLSEKTIEMRTKEYAHDYRYFPEPDLVPLEPDPGWIEEIRKSLGELPQIRKNRFMTSYQLTAYDSQLLIANKTLADFFEECVKLYNQPKIIVNWLRGDLTAYLNANKMTIEQTNLTPAQLVEILQLIDKKTISGKIAKQLLLQVLDTGKAVKDLMKELDLKQITDEEELKRIIEAILKSHPQTKEDYQKGKPTALTYLMGQVMKATQGKANPTLTNKLLKEVLDKIVLLG